MRIEKYQVRPQNKPPSEWFYGIVFQEPIIEAPEPARNRSLKVLFEAGARTAWHTHPLGQTLYVLSGVGLVSLRNEAPRVIKLGDSVWIPPDVEHWHGATPNKSMTHIAIQESLNGKVANWLEHVSERDYLRNPVD